MVSARNVAFLLRLLSIPRVGPAKVSALIDWASSKGVSSEHLLEEPSLLEEKLTEEQISVLRETDHQVGLWLDRLDDIGATAVTILDESYPRRLRTRLGRRAPPVLTILGNAEVLERNAIGFCGSRKASEKGLTAAEDCADQLARCGINIVSGYASGVDMMTHATALKAGGTTTIVIAEGLFNFAIKRHLREIWDWNRVAVISEFLPDSTWSVSNAMQRNRTICACADAMILIEAGATGGSVAAGRACIEMGLPLFAAIYSGMPEFAIGNQLLLHEGAVELRKSASTNRAKLDKILSVIGSS